ncbi:MAG: hypothetical protein ABW004_00715, partial [Aeromicrobium sp.]
FLGAATPTLSAATLAPGQSANASVVYTVTQGDVDAGSVVNSATASGQNPGLQTVTSAASSVTTATVPADPEIAITKTASPVSAAGQTVTWTFVLANPGNVTLTGVTLADSIPGANPTITTWPSGVAGRLDPGDEIEVTSTTVVSQADVDAGSLVNVVTATGTPPTGAAATATATATAPLTPTGALALTKTAVAPNPVVLGSTIRYDFSLVNTGNVTLTGIDIADELAGLGAVTSTGGTGTAASLAPSQTLLASAPYVVTQADIDNGVVTNVARATGTTPAGALITSPGSAVDVTTVTRAPQLTTTKTSTLAGAGAVGDVITYTITIRNSGNTSVENVVFSDSQPGLGAFDIDDWPSGVEGLLLPGDEVVATATYVITQADVDAGSVTNVATGSGTAAVTGAPVSDDSDPNVQPTIARTTTIEVEKSGVLEPGSTGRAGDEILYTFTLTNLGNVTMTGVVFTDPLVTIDPAAYVWPAATPAGTLLPGAAVTATAEYEISQADVDAGSVANIVTGSATPPGTGQSPVTDTDAETIPLAPDASLSAVKTGTLQPGAIGAVGDLIDYVVTVTNTGNVTVHDGQLLDPLPGISTPVITWPNPAQPGVLPVGQSVTGEATYPLTQADIDRGYISNIADVSALTPTNQLVLATTNEVIIPTVQAAPGVVLEKTVTAGAGGDLGDDITYGFTVRNTGNVTLTNLVLSDPLVGAITVTGGTGSLASLAPGQTVIASATHEITQSDLNAGEVRNTASVSATTPALTTISADSLEVVTPTIAVDPSLTVSKTGSIPTGVPATVGTVISYDFVVTNDGNVRLSAIDLVDQLPQLSGVTFGTWPGTPAHAGILDPTESVTATATYAIQQTDIDAGAVTNTVTAIGTPLVGGQARANDSDTVPITPTP